MKPETGTTLDLTLCRLLAVSLLLAAPTLWGQQRDRLAGWVNDSVRVPLRAAVHPLAKSEFDQGPVDPSMPLDSIVMGLKRTEQQQADLDELLTKVQDLASPPLYHHWLSPERVAGRFGVSHNDIDKITAWLVLNDSSFRASPVGGTLSCSRARLPGRASAAYVHSPIQGERGRNITPPQEHCRFQRNWWI